MNEAPHTPTPWKLCYHLSNAEQDRKCPCGYRGGIWGGSGDDELLVCEMRNCGNEMGHEMIPIGSRETQLANAAFLVEAVNSHAALVAENARLKAEAEWLALNAGAEHPHYPYRNDLGYWAFPYLVSNAGGFGGGVGEASFNTLSEAIAAARDFKAAA